MRSDGIATLEMALCMPILMLLIVCLVWLGGAMIRQSEVTVQARNDAFKLRNSEELSQRFEFGQSGRASALAQEDVTLGSLFNSVQPARSLHVTLAGAWDHEQIKLDRIPNFKLALELARRGPPNDIRTRIAAARALPGDLKYLAQSVGELSSAGSGSGAGSRSLGEAERYSRVLKQALGRKTDGLAPAINTLGQLAGNLDRLVSIDGLRNLISSSAEVFLPQVNVSEYPAGEAFRSRIQQAVQTKLLGIQSGLGVYDQVADLIRQIQGGRSRIMQESRQRYERQRQEIQSILSALQGASGTVSENTEGSAANKLSSASERINQLLADDAIDADTLVKQIEKIAGDLTGVESEISSAMDQFYRLQLKAHLANLVAKLKKLGSDVGLSPLLSEQFGIPSSIPGLNNSQIRQLAAGEVKADELVASMSNENVVAAIAAFVDRKSSGLVAISPEMLKYMRQLKGLKKAADGTVDTRRSLLEIVAKYRRSQESNSDKDDEDDKENAAKKAERELAALKNEIRGALSTLESARGELRTLTESIQQALKALNEAISKGDTAMSHVENQQTGSLPN